MQFSCQIDAFDYQWVFKKVAMNRENFSHPVKGRKKEY